MKIIRHVAVASSEAKDVEQFDLGLRRGPIVTTFDIDESDPRWPAVRSWIETARPMCSVTTKFSSSEIRRSAWLVLMPTWHWGYPQPDEDDFGYLTATYDLADYCAKCGVGLRQRAPFIMASEPSWGKKAVLQLNWVFDEYFVTPDLWHRVFRPLGVPTREVLGPTGCALKNVVQLDIQTRVTIDTGGLEGSSCEQCGRVKYRPVTRGVFPSIRRSGACEVVRTEEVFGSGADAHNEIVISGAVREALQAGMTKGVSFWPAAAAH